GRAGACNLVPALRTLKYIEVFGSLTQASQIGNMRRKNSATGRDKGTSFADFHAGAEEGRHGSRSRIIQFSPCPGRGVGRKYPEYSPRPNRRGNPSIDQ